MRRVESGLKSSQRLPRFYPQRPLHGFLAFAAFAGLLGGCSSNSGKNAQAASPGQLVVPVTVAPVVAKSMSLELRGIGSVESYSTVSLKSQVSARVESVHFKEGQDVHKGDLLFTLDKRPFEADLRLNQANLERDIARANNAATQAQRFADLFQQGIASKQQNDDMSSAATAAQATLQADREAIEAAKLKLAYCTITSPIDGRTGSILVYPGNLVKENDVPVMVVINQVQPIFVNFPVPEQNLTDIKRFMAQRRLEMVAEIPQLTSVKETGILTFVDNTVDRTTGTIRLKATFDNTERRLWPGQFVNVSLKLTDEAGRVVIPSRAVQTGQSGQYVFVVKQDNTVEVRNITIARSSALETIIEKGLQPGETVVTDGQLRLVPGATVQIRGGL